jgi:hypothetical protein
MAKTTGPLFSLDASGTVGGVVTYSQWKGRSYVRRHVIPLNPYEADQVAARNRIRCMGAAVAWANLTANKRTPPGITDKAAIVAIVPPEYGWNGYLTDKAIGPAAAAYDEAEAIWTVFTAPNKTAWDDAADALVPAIPPVAQGQAGGGFTTPLTSGNVFLHHMYGLYKMGLYTLPTAVPPTYA